jgi:hypothetical protein
VAQRSYNADAVAQFSAKLNAQYSRKSPLTAQDRAVLKSLDFFLQNNLFCDCKLVRTP